MANNKKPRKAYRPKGIIGALPVTFGCDPEAMTNLKLQPHQILEAFKRGDGSEEGAHTLAACINIGAVLSRTQSKEVQGIISAGLDAVQNVMNHGNTIGKWIMTGDDIRGIGEAITLTDDMQDITTRRELKTAIKAIFDEGAVLA